MNTQTGKCNDERYGRCRMSGKRGLALTVKYARMPRLTCGIHKFREIQILSRNSKGEQKEKKPEKILGNLPNFLWAHSPLTWQAHREIQLASCWLSKSFPRNALKREWLSQSVSMRSIGLFCSWNSFFVQKCQNSRMFFWPRRDLQLPKFSTTKWSTLHHLLLFRKS